MARILVADDAPAVLDVVEEVLTRVGHHVVRAESGSEAIRRFTELRPSLAVLDVMLPDIDGLAVLDAIRRLDRGVPVIIITGVEDGGRTGRRAADLPGVAFFEKTSGLDRFVELVRRILGGTGTAAP